MAYAIEKELAKMCRKNDSLTKLKNALISVLRMRYEKESIVIAKNESDLYSRLLGVVLGDVELLEPINTILKTNRMKTLGCFLTEYNSKRLITCLQSNANSAVNEEKTNIINSGANMSGLEPFDRADAPIITMDDTPKKDICPKCRREVITWYKRSDDGRVITVMREKDGKKKYCYLNTAQSQEWKESHERQYAIRKIKGELKAIPK